MGMQAMFFLATVVVFGLSVEGAEAVGEGTFELSHALANGAAFAVALEVTLLAQRVPRFAVRFPLVAITFLAALTLASLVGRDESLGLLGALAVVLAAAFSAASFGAGVEARFRRRAEDYQRRHTA